MTATWSRITPNSWYILVVTVSILVMSSTEFYSLVYHDIPRAVSDVIYNYNRHYYNTAYTHDAGIYIYGVYKGTSQNIYLTFLDTEGSDNSLEFMMATRTRVHDILYELLDRFGSCAVSIAITDWCREDCDILSTCEDLHPDGVLVYDIDGDSGLLHYVTNGKRVS